MYQAVAGFTPAWVICRSASPHAVFHTSSTWRSWFGTAVIETVQVAVAQSSSSVLHDSVVPATAVQPMNAPALQVSMPATHSPVSVPQRRVMPLSITLSQSSSRLLQLSVRGPTLPEHPWYTPPTHCWRPVE